MSLANRQSIQQAVCRQTYLCSILRSAIAEPANIRRQSAANSCLLFSDTELTLCCMSLANRQSIQQAVCRQTKVCLMIGDTGHSPGTEYQELAVLST